MLQKLLRLPLITFLLAIAVLVFAAVVFRYVLRTPLVYSFELSSLLFAWLIFLGSISAYVSRNHLRVDLLAGRASSRIEAISDFIAEAVVMLCCLYIAYHAYILFNRTGLRIASLGISNRWLYLVVPVSMGMICLISTLRAYSALGRFLWPSR